MAKTLRNRTVVITGASSGIGRTTARAFARCGANLVLAARREELLKDLAEECHRWDVRAIAVPTDVSREADVQALARAAIAEFGEIDIWVNNAGVLLWGEIDSTPIEEWRRVIDVNLFGCVHGARAVLPHFRQRGHGTLINTSSIVSVIGQPQSSAYVASKFAVRGLTVALRQDLAAIPGIQVCAVLPSVIDTPLFQHGGNRLGRQIQAPPPVYDPTLVAQAIIAQALRPRRERVVGLMGKMAVAQHSLLPDLTEKFMTLFTRKLAFGPKLVAQSPGNLFQGAQGIGERGGWQILAARREQMFLSRLAIGAAAIGAGALLLGRLARR